MSFTWEERFDQLAELDAGERDRRLAALEGEDPGLAGLLRELLAADAGDGDPLALAGRAPTLLAAALAARPLPAPSGRDRAGQRIGPYRLLSLLGRGGMAEVWLAERADGELDYRAALKLVRPGSARRPSSPAFCASGGSSPGCSTRRSPASSTAGAAPPASPTSSSSWSTARRSPTGARRAAPPWKSACAW